MQYDGRSQDQIPKVVEHSATPSRDARHFPPRPVSETLMGSLLNRCVWYAGVSDPTLMYFRLILNRNL